jgi:predicted RND superfamily exporter protein
VSRWSIIAHARSVGALALLVVVVGTAFVLGRQAITFIGAPAAIATANAAKVALAAGSS